MSHRPSVINWKPALHTHSVEVSKATVSVSNVTAFDSVRSNFTGKNYRILLAHDLTGHSEIALVRAIRLTLERNGHLNILHVVSSGLTPEVSQARRADAKRHLESQVRRWAGRSQLSYSIDLGIGEAPDAVAARAKARNIDLVVIGRHPRSTLSDAFTPSIVARLLQRTHQPVLIVNNSNQSPYQRILVPVDFSKASATRIRFATTFLPRSCFHFLFVQPRRFPSFLAPLSVMSNAGEEAWRPFAIGDRRCQQASSWLTEHLGLDRRPLITIDGRRPLPLLKQELARQKTDLVVLENHTRSNSVLTGRAAEISALRASSCDVLVAAPDRLA